MLGTRLEQPVSVRDVCKPGLPPANAIDVSALRAASLPDGSFFCLALLISGQVPGPASSIEDAAPKGKREPEQKRVDKKVPQTAEWLYATIENISTIYFPPTVGW